MSAEDMLDSLPLLEIWEQDGSLNIRDKRQLDYIRGIFENPILRELYDIPDNWREIVEAKKNEYYNDNNYSGKNDDDDFFRDEAGFPLTPDEFFEQNETIAPRVDEFLPEDWEVINLIEDTLDNSDDISVLGEKKLKDLLTPERMKRMLPVFEQWENANLAMTPNEKKIFSYIQWQLNRPDDLPEIPDFLPINEPDNTTNITPFSVLDNQNLPAVPQERKRLQNYQKPDTHRSSFSHENTSSQSQKPNITVNVHHEDVNSLPFLWPQEKNDSAISDSSDSQYLPAVHPARKRVREYQKPDVHNDEFNPIQNPNARSFKIGRKKIGTSSYTPELFVDVQHLDVNDPEFQPPAYDNSLNANPDDDYDDDSFIGQFHVEHDGKIHTLNVFDDYDDEVGSFLELADHNGTPVAYYIVNSDTFSIYPEFYRKGWTRNIEEEFRKYLPDLLKKTNIRPAKNSNDDDENKTDNNPDDYDTSFEDDYEPKRQDDNDDDLVDWNEPSQPDNQDNDLSVIDDDNDDGFIGQIHVEHDGSLHEFDVFEDFLEDGRKFYDVSDYNGNPVVMYLKDSDSFHFYPEFAAIAWNKDIENALRKELPELLKNSESDKTTHTSNKIKGEPLPDNAVLKDGTLTVTLGENSSTLNVKAWVKGKDNKHRRLYFNQPDTSGKNKRGLSLGYFDANTGTFEDFNPSYAGLNNAIQNEFIEHIHDFYDLSDIANSDNLTPFSILDNEPEPDSRLTDTSRPGYRKRNEPIFSFYGNGQNGKNVVYRLRPHPQSNKYPDRFIVDKDTYNPSTGEFQESYQYGQFYDGVLHYPDGTPIDKYSGEHAIFVQDTVREFLNKRNAQPSSEGTLTPFSAFSKKPEPKHDNKPDSEKKSEATKNNKSDEPAILPFFLKVGAKNYRVTPEADGRLHAVRQDKIGSVTVIDADEGLFFFDNHLHRLDAHGNDLGLRNRDKELEQAIINHLDELERKPESDTKPETKAGTTKKNDTKTAASKRIIPEKARLNGGSVNIGEYAAEDGFSKGNRLTAAQGKFEVVANNDDNVFYFNHGINRAVYKYYVDDDLFTVNVSDRFYDSSLAKEVERVFREHINEFYSIEQNQPVSKPAQETEHMPQPEIFENNPQQTSSQKKRIIPEGATLKDGTVNIGEYTAEDDLRTWDRLTAAEGKFTVTADNKHDVLLFNHDINREVYKYYVNDDLFATNVSSKFYNSSIAKEVERVFREHLNEFYSIEQNQPEHHDVPDNTPNNTPVRNKKDNGTHDLNTAPFIEIAEKVKDHVLNGRSQMSNKQLFDIADEAFGGTVAEGKYTTKDAYDAMELGINLAIQESGTTPASVKNIDDVLGDLDSLNDLLQLIPTQRNRTDEQIEFQQFSTPPTLAYIVNWLANIQPDDYVLEPSAGVGSLAVFAQNSYANLILNELHPRRAALLEQLFGIKPHKENAEHINDILAPKIKNRPDIVIMNPPFSATAGRVSKHDSRNAMKHVEQALQLLDEGGRLVAVLGQNMTNNSATYNKWWKHLKEKYNVRAILSIDGSNYKKFGTTFGNIIVVIDKNGDTTEGSTFTASFKTLDEIVQNLTVQRIQHDNFEDYDDVVDEPDNDIDDDNDDLDADVDETENDNDSSIGQFNNNEPVGEFNFDVDGHIHTFDVFADEDSETGTFLTLEDKNGTPFASYTVSTDEFSLYPDGERLRGGYSLEDDFRKQLPEFLKGAGINTSDNDYDYEPDDDDDNNDDWPEVYDINLAMMAKDKTDEQFIGIAEKLKRELNKQGKNDLADELQKFIDKADNERTNSSIKILEGKIYEILEPLLKEENMKQDALAANNDDDDDDTPEYEPEAKNEPKIELHELFDAQNGDAAATGSEKSGKTKHEETDTEKQTRKVTTYLPNKKNNLWSILTDIEDANELYAVLFDKSKKQLLSIADTELFNATNVEIFDYDSKLDTLQKVLAEIIRRYDIIDNYGEVTGQINGENIILDTPLIRARIELRDKKHNENKPDNESANTQTSTEDVKEQKPEIKSNNNTQQDKQPRKITAHEPESKSDKPDKTVKRWNALKKIHSDDELRKFLSRITKDQLIEIADIERFNDTAPNVSFDKSQLKADLVDKVFREITRRYSIIDDGHDVTADINGENVILDTPLIRARKEFITSSEYQILKSQQLREQKLEAEIEKNKPNGYIGSVTFEVRKDVPATLQIIETETPNKNGKIWTFIEEGPGIAVGTYSPDIGLDSIEFFETDLWFTNRHSHGVFHTKEAKKARANFKIAFSNFLKENGYTYDDNPETHIVSQTKAGSTSNLKVDVKSDEEFKADALKELKEQRNLNVQDSDNDDEPTDASVFSTYRPAIKIKGAKEHPADLVESSAMASVRPPKVTYSPNLPDYIINEGRLSIAQLEAVTYAGQSFTHRTPNDERRGFFIGDGTGVGKGREISGIIMDQLRQGHGKGKAVWISNGHSLIKDAKRDWQGLGNNPDDIFAQEDISDKQLQAHDEGIIFTAYSYFTGKAKDRIPQLKNWLGEDFDGVIVLDECHRANNAMTISEGGKKYKPSATALGISDFVKAFPNARVLYVSATGATDVRNLSMLDRLGLWGNLDGKNGFKNDKDFVTSISKGGVAAMEVVARDLKAMGLFISRTLSMRAGPNGGNEDVTFRTLVANLTEHQKAIYDKLAEMWQKIYANIDKAIELCGGEENKRFGAKTKFQNYRQQFFSQVLTTFQTPATIQDMEAQIAKGNSIVIQLTNTYESAQERAVDDLEDRKRKGEDVDFDDLDISPMQLALAFLEKCFPIYVMQEVEVDGNIVLEPAKDEATNKPIISQEALAMREELTADVRSIQAFTQSPIDMILDHFGHDNVAEITGRKTRYVLDSNGKRVKQKRKDENLAAEIDDFNAGRKHILIFSGKGDTGASYHASNDYENKQKRIHYLLQAGWRADKAIQGLGRTHRSNEAHKPEYVLVTTDMPGQKRFISTIARRLEQLGALTSGERKASSNGLFSAADNLENKYVAYSLTTLFKNLIKGEYPEFPNPDEIFEQLAINHDKYQEGLQGFLNQRGTKGNEPTFNKDEVTTFLNRVLGLTVDTQKKLWARFEDEINWAIEFSRENGTLDMGTENINVVSFNVNKEEIIRESSDFGTQTKYVELAVERTIKPRTWDEVRHKKGVEFYIRDDGVILAAVPRKLNASDIEAGVKNAFRLYFVNPMLYDDKSDYILNNQSAKQKHAYTKLSNDEAKSIWEKKVDEFPSTYTEIKHMITGVLLPVWKLIKSSTPRIQRIVAQNGDKVLGRIVPEKELQSTLSELGLDSLKKQNEKVNAKSLRAKLNEFDGAIAVLASGVEVKYVRVNGHKRLEVMNLDFYSAQKFIDNGDMLKEIINSKKRYFVTDGSNIDARINRLLFEFPFQRIKNSRANRL